MKNKSKTKLFIAIFSFLLLIPFRLPISVLLIDMFNSIAQIGGKEIPLDILRANVTITKIVYNLILSSIMVYNIEHLSRGIMCRKSDETFYWWTGILGILLLIYQGFDGYWTTELFNVITS